MDLTDPPMAPSDYPLGQQDVSSSEDDDLLLEDYKPFCGLPSGNHKWTIPKFSTQPKSFYSDSFIVGCFSWCIRVSKNEDSGYFSICLKFGDSVFAKLKVHVQFCFSLVNQTNPQLTIRKDTKHKFAGFDLESWGFPAFISLKELHEQYIVNDTCVIEADVAVNSITGLSGLEYPRIGKAKEEELEGKEEDDVRSYVAIKVACTKDLLQQIGSVIYFDLVDHNMVTTFIFQRMKSFACFQEEVHKKLGIPMYCQRFWLWARRVNDTYRPLRPLTRKEQSKSIYQLRKFTTNEYGAELRLFLEEVECGKDFHPMPPPEKTNNDILLFFKLYDPFKEELRYVGSFLVKKHGTPSDIFEKLKEMAGFSNDDEIMLYEEIRYEPKVMIELIDKDRTFRSSEITDGDIICFQQKQPLVGSRFSYPDVPSFLKHMHNFEDPHFRYLEQLTDYLLCLVRDSAAPGAITETLGNTGRQVTLNMSGDLGVCTVPNQPDVPVEEYATQLSLLQKMRFFDTDENIRALRATSGNLRAAIKRLLLNPDESGFGFFKLTSARDAIA